MQIHSNTLTFFANPCKYSSFFMQIHANTLVFYANACKYSRFLCKSMQIQSFFMQILSFLCKYVQILSSFMQIQTFFMQMHFLLKKFKIFQNPTFYANAPGFGLKGTKYPFFAQIVKLLSKTDIFCIFVQMHPVFI